MDINKESIKEYAGKYDERYRGTKDEAVEREIKAWFEAHRYLDKKEFIKIGLWKTKRPQKYYESNDDLTVREITRFSLTTGSEEARIKALLILHGVSYPVASVILHFAFPNQYPILDFRVIWSVGCAKPKNYTLDFWENYCDMIRGIAEEIKMDIRMIDKALWMYSKENQ